MKHHHLRPPIVHIIDDEASVRAALTFLLEGQDYRVKSWPNGAAFLASAPPPAAQEIALIDVRMPQIDGLELQERLILSGRPVAVIMMTAHADIAMAVRAMRNGAVTFLEKPFESKVLLQALVDAQAEADGDGARKQQCIEAELMLQRLTPREKEVLQGLTQGLSNKEIGRTLGLSPRTVETHRAALMAKFGARSLSEALRIAFLSGADGPLL